jgi:hypothetical protein
MKLISKFKEAVMASKKAAKSKDAKTPAAPAVEQTTPAAAPKAAPKPEFPEGTPVWYVREPGQGLEVKIVSVDAKGNATLMFPNGRTLERVKRGAGNEGKTWEPLPA